MLISFEQGENYLYTTTRPHFFTTNLAPDLHAKTKFLDLQAGVLSIMSGYSFDGASGAIDTSTVMAAALCHDALYQLMRDWYIPLSCRKPADQLFYNICRESGCSWFRAQYMYRAIRMFGAKAAGGGR